MQVLKNGLRYLYGVFFVLAGVNHFWHTAFYMKIMPPYLPLHRELVYLSGVFEIALGALLLYRRTARLAGWGLVLLLIAVFPANIYVFQHQDVAPGPPLLHLLRLPLQGLLIAWAYWYTRPNGPADVSSPSRPR